MSSSRALCYLPSVKKQKHDFFFIQCIIKQLLDSVFVISTIIKVSVRVRISAHVLTVKTFVLHSVAKLLVERRSSIFSKAGDMKSHSSSAKFDVKLQ